MSNIDAVMATISERGDWRRIRGLYKQFSAIAPDVEPPTDLAGGLAEALTRTFASYEDHETSFVTDLAQLMGAIDGYSDSPPPERFWFLYKDIRLENFPAYRAHTGGKRRPRPFEAAVETVRRIADLNQVRDRLERLSTSAILGGSASYGRFYNTAGSVRERPSDLDLLVVIPSYDDLPHIVTAMSELAFIDPKGIDVFHDRVAYFSEVRGEHGRCAFQQKLSMWPAPSHAGPAYHGLPGFYSLALHAFDLDDFNYLALRDIHALHDGFSRTLSEYRGDKPAAKDELRSFAGTRHSVDTAYVEVRNGVVAKTRHCEVTDERFYPGVHMNLLLPQLEVRWESPRARVRLALLDLRWKLLARLAEERRLRSHEIQRLSLSHTRVAAFAPHVTRRVDRD
ncbi:MAG TPA: hypothetical protein VF517_05135 [Thermoleophilaceae bacterium]|jgi:hypothetical protein